ncbi:hypothetical protein [Haladaptatus cibarius]|uniref:hypothetical protein n=1 Tax=Haladaptatus cibarius TaxID=453847 RepID=UPI000679D5CC|nr:hypothetical protein [Haladaptatus cibarius]
MTSLSERWFSRFSDDWEDPSTARGFFGGLWQIGLQTVLFVLLFYLSISMDIAKLGGWYLPNDFILAFSVLLGILLGGGLNYLHYTRERFKRLGRTFTYRITMIIGVYGLYVLLLSIHSFHGIMFALANIVAKILLLLGMTISRKL